MWPFCVTSRTSRVTSSTMMSSSCSHLCTSGGFPSLDAGLKSPAAFVKWKALDLARSHLAKGSSGGLPEAGASRHPFQTGTTMAVMLIYAGVTEEREAAMVQGAGAVTVEAPASATTTAWGPGHNGRYVTRPRAKACRSTCLRGRPTKEHVPPRFKCG